MATNDLPAGTSTHPALLDHQRAATPSPAVWLVTGAARGLGREIAAAALRHGDRVVAAARHPEQITETLGHYPELLLPVALDVTDPTAAQAAVDQAVVRFGRLDVVVNNAGFGLFGAVEETTADDLDTLFATNVHGVLNLARAALPQLRAQRSGRVITVSSLGGFEASSGWGVYGASKAAIEGISEALAAELAPFGVQVTIVEPGFLRTDFLAGTSLHQVSRNIDDYDTSLDRAAAARADGNQPGDPAKAADAIVAVAHTPTPPRRLALGADALTRIRNKLITVSSDLNTWEELSRSIARPEHGPEMSPMMFLLTAGDRQRKAMSGQ
jgi:NAD(P)-dependent dehydrogenase (short-subunit alcohol dehydrogenase family)